MPGAIIFRALLPVLLLSSAAAAYCQEGPVEPNVSNVPDVTIPDLTVPDDGSGKQPLVLVHVRLTLSDGAEASGIWPLSNDVLFAVSNSAGKTLTVKNYTVYNVNRIEIVRWKQSRQDRSLFLFKPAVYKVYTNESVYFLRQEPFPAGERIVLEDGDKKKAFFSLFYDSWVEGLKGVFRWENSKYSRFDYNLDHPIPGVVTAIRFEGR